VTDTESELRDIEYLWRRSELDRVQAAERMQEFLRKQANSRPRRPRQKLELLKLRLLNPFNLEQWR
jgi:hypothetical protein